MRPTFFVAAFLMTIAPLSHPARADADCAPAPHPALAGLSLYWAQELVGIDLLRREASPELLATQVLVATPEQGFNDHEALWHGQRHNALIADAQWGSAAPKVEFIWPQNGRGPDDAFVRALRERQPQLLCSSASDGAGDWEAMAAMFEAFARPDRISLFAAGNEGVPTLDRRAPQIAVGSLSPLGVKSSFSNVVDPDDASARFIYAPSDSFITAQLNGQPQRFGGTSGAQPLVCGSAVNALATLPGLRGDEFWNLLRGTASQTQGLATLNAYRLFRCAQRLRADWPANRALLASEKDLAGACDFRAEADVESQRAAATVSATAAATTAPAAADACALRDAGEAMRRAWLLDASPARGLALAKNYERRGLVMNASYVRYAPGVDETILVYAQEHPSMPIRAAALRELATRKSPRGIKIAREQLPRLLADAQSSREYMRAALMNLRDQNMPVIEQSIDEFYAAAKVSAERKSAVTHLLRELDIRSEKLLDSCQRHQVKPCQYLAPPPRD